MRIPLWIEVEGLRVLVVGGGGVGTRRALKFYRAGAHVKVVSLWFSDQLKSEAEKSGGRLELVEADARQRSVLEPLVAWADIVVIATDNPEVNKLVWEVAKSMRKLVNDATDAERTQIVVPYEGEVLGLRFAVTSEGKSGVAARWARDRIIECLKGDHALATLFAAMSRAKVALKRVIPVAKERIPVYFKIEGDEVFRSAIEAGDLEKAVRRAAEIIAEEANKKGYKVTVDDVLRAMEASHEASSQKP